MQRLDTIMGDPHEPSPGVNRVDAIHPPYGSLAKIKLSENPK